MLTMIPGQQLAEVAGIPDKRCISELAYVEIAIDLKVTDAALRGGQLRNA